MKEGIDDINGPAVAGTVSLSGDPGSLQLEVRRDFHDNWLNIHQGEVEFCNSTVETSVYLRMVPATAPESTADPVTFPSQFIKAEQNPGTKELTIQFDKDLDFADQCEGKGIFCRGRPQDATVTLGCPGGIKVSLLDWIAN